MTEVSRNYHNILGAKIFQILKVEPNRNAEKNAPRPHKYATCSQNEIEHIATIHETKISKTKKLFDFCISIYTRQTPL